MKSNPLASTKTRVLVAIIACVVVGVVLAGWLWPRGEEPELASAGDQATLAGAEAAPSAWTPSTDEQEQSWTSKETLPDGTQVRYETKGDQPPAELIRHEELPEHMVNFQKVVEDYFAASPEQRVALLDKHIDQMTAFQEKFAGQDGGNVDFEMKEHPGQKARKITLKMDTEGGKQNVEIEGVEPGELKQMQKQYLEAGDPVMRARLSEYSRALRERMRERGMEGQVFMMAFQEEEKK
jgi:hypothetical protein